MIRTFLHFNFHQKFIIVLFLSYEVQPTCTLVKLGSKVPSFRGTFIAPTASIVGDVSIGHGSAVWYGAVLRGKIFFAHIISATSISFRAWQ